MPSPAQRVPARGRELLGDDPQQGRLAAAVGADDADALAAHHHEVDVEQDRIVAVGRVDAFQRQHALAAARAGPQRERHPAPLEHRPLDLLHAVDLHLLDARLAGGALVDADVRPVPEAPHGLLEARDLLLLGHVDLLLAFQLELAGDDVGAVGAGPDPDRAAVEFGDLRHRRIEQVAVVGDHHHGAVEVVEQRGEALAAAPCRGAPRARRAAARRAAGPGRRRARRACAGRRRARGSARRGRRSRAPAGARAPRPRRGRRRPRSSAASARSWRARAFVIASRSDASAGSASRASAACSSLSSCGELGPRREHGRQRVALVAVDDLRQVGEHEPAPARDRSGVGRVESGEDPHQRRLAAAVRAEHADPRARLHVEVGAAQDRAPAEGLR